MASFTAGSVVRLRSRYKKYLIAKEDKISVSQGPDGLEECAKWTIEGASEGNIRLRSCYEAYLTASTETFGLGGAGCKVIQSPPRNLDSSAEWKPIIHGRALKLQTASGTFLRAKGGLSLHGNSVTHDNPFRASSKDDIVWFVGHVESTSQPHHGDVTGAENVPTNRTGYTQRVNPGGRCSLRGAMDMASDAANVAGAGITIFDMLNDNQAADDVDPDEDGDEDA